MRYQITLAIVLSATLAGLPALAQDNDQRSAQQSERALPFAPEWSQNVIRDVADPAQRCFAGTNTCHNNVVCPPGTAICGPATQRNCAIGQRGQVSCDGQVSYCEPCLTTPPFSVSLDCSGIGIENHCYVRFQPYDINPSLCTYDWRYVSHEAPLYWSAIENHAEVILNPSCSPTSINTVRVSVYCPGRSSTPTQVMANIPCDPGGPA